MWKTIYSKQPKLSKNTVGCYNAGSAQGNTDCAVSKQLFLQQPASLQSTDLCTLYRRHLRKYDVQFRKLIRRIVGPPPGTNWSAQWHDILHGGSSSWSEKCMIQYWNLGSYIANLPAERWVRRALAWNPFPTNRSRGRPQQIWDTKLEMFCRYKALDNLENVATNAVQLHWARLRALGLT